jgi:hypothetical protein
VDKVLRGYSDKAPIEYNEFALCREMGWDFNQLESQPAWRIEQAFLFLSREAHYQKTQQNS